MSEDRGLGLLSDRFEDHRRRLFDFLLERLSVRDDCVVLVTTPFSAGARVLVEKSVCVRNEVRSRALRSSYDVLHNFFVQLTGLCWCFQSRRIIALARSVVVDVVTLCAIGGCDEVKD